MSDADKYKQPGKEYMVFQPRASMIGKSENEIYRYFTGQGDLDEKSGAMMSADAGTTLHRLVQAQQYSAGNINTAEKFVFNSKYNFTGHIDAISPTLGIGDIKTVSRSTFNKIRQRGARDYNISQINSYMATTGIKQGYLQYVMREDPTQQLVFKFDYNPDLFKADMQKIERVRNRILSELDQGRLSYSQLRQGDSADVLAEAGKNAHNELIEDISNIEMLVDRFMYQQGKLEIASSQSISRNSRKSNNPINPVGRRESRNTVPGMLHGGFGSQRSQRTDFGSPFRMGDQHQRFSINDNGKPTSIDDLDKLSINRYFANQMGLDLETLALKGGQKSTFEIGLGYGDGRYKALFLQQPDDFKFSGFLKDNSRLGQVYSGKENVFSKLGKLEGFADTLFQQEEKRRLKQIEAEVVTRQIAREQLVAFFDTSKSKKKTIFTSNGNFEVDHLKFVTKDNTVGYSKEYIEIRKQLNEERSYDMARLQMGELSNEEMFNKEYNRRLKRLNQYIKDTTSGGNMAEATEAYKMLNAMAQQKGLIPKTGNFSIGTQIDYLSKHFIGPTEWHEGITDIDLQNKLIPKIMTMLHGMNTGEITKDNYREHGMGSWVDDWNSNLRSIHLEATKRKIVSEFEAKGHISDIDIRRNLRQTGMLVDEREIFNQALNEIPSELKVKIGLKEKSLSSIEKATGTAKYVRFGMLAGAGFIGVAAALKNMFNFSGRDDEANTLEGLGHGGVAQVIRDSKTDFGSGFQMKDYHDYDQSADPTPNSFMPIAGVGGAIFGSKLLWKIPTNIKINDIAYLGQITPGKTNAEVLGRENATVGDIALATVKRAESSMGGFPKAFGISDIIGTPAYDGATFTVDLLQKKNETYAKYIDKLTNRKLLEEGAHAVTYKNNKLWIHKEGVTELVEGNFNLIRLSHDLNQNEALSQFAKSALRTKGLDYIDPKVHAFIPVGGKELHNSTAAQRIHIYAHETFSKYLQLMDDPLKAFEELFPDVKHPAMNAFKKVLSYVPKLGVGGEAGLKGNIGQLAGRHAVRLGAYGTAAYFGLGTLNWMVKQISPDNTAMGEAGILGAGAEVLKTAHEAYAKTSDILGLTQLRDKMEEWAPGMNGWSVPLGVGLSGALAGATIAVGEDLAIEGLAKGDHYNAFLKAREEVHEMPEALKRVPGFGKKYTRVGKYARMGGALGLALSAPWIISGIGADKSFDQLRAEYSGEKEVAIRKGRFWEASMGKWEGDQIEYYRPNWYAKIKDNAKKAELYDGDDISPIGKAVRGLIDPYWLERRRYEEQPYAYTGPDGSAFGMFGSLYEATIGRALKAPALMHQEELQSKLGSSYSDSPEGMSVETITPGSTQSLFKKQWDSLLEAMGLRGFVGGAIAEAATGEGGTAPQLASAAGMDSIVKSYTEMQLGGGVLTTEAVRRVLQDGKSGTTEINPLRNKMPSWMPGNGNYINFHEGDPYAKVKEGYYRLPGEGFATRYEELKGVNPEDYPDIYKYKILADVAPTSQQFKTLKEQLSQRALTADELGIYNTANEQLEEKKKSELNVRDPAMYDTLLGRYGAFLTDTARSNPAEQLLPFSPAHKFLPGLDAEDAYQESIYGKQFKNWANPYDDFIAPTIRLALNSVGLGGTPSYVEDRNQLEDYFDKLQYYKNMKLADAAERSGDQGSANIYRSKAGKTLSSIDPYASTEEIMAVLPKRERAYFDQFSGATGDERQRILSMVTPSMRDIYQAQWDKADLNTINMDASVITMEDKDAVERKMAERASAIRARRKSDLIEFSKGDLPSDDWEGWNPEVNLEDVKMQYVVNNGKNYHDYGLWKDRLNSLARKPLARAAAENLNYRPPAYTNKYAEAYSQAQNAGIINPRISILPGIESGTDAEIESQRDDERRSVLRDLGHLL